MSEKKDAPVAVGIVSIFTVLLVLTLSVFAALTLSSARADLALSRINAETVSAYYAADSTAHTLYEEFAAGDEKELVTQIPISERQILSIHLVRQKGEVQVLAWQVVPVEDAAAQQEQHLPVWDGEGE